MNPSYATTVFQASPPPKGWPCAFAIVTAWNPPGKNVSDAMNAERDRNLAERLDGIVPRPWRWRVTGGSPDFTYAECGFAVDLPLAEALAIGRKFEQEAIFWIENDELQLVACDGPAQQHLGSWTERLTRGNALSRHTKHSE